MNDRWLYFPMNESLSQQQQDLAIRRFCPARANEQEYGLQGSGGDDQQYYCYSNWEEEEYRVLLLNDHHDKLSWSPTTIFTDTAVIASPHDHLATSVEEGEFVDSFLINMDCCNDQKDDDHNTSTTAGKLPAVQKHPVVLDLFQSDLDDDLENLSMVLNDDDDDHHHVYREYIIPTTMVEGGREDLEETEMSSSCIEDFGEGEGVGVEVDQGLQLVHLLLACAEAVGCRDTQLAASMLNQIWPCVSPWGDSLQRVSYCFATGLKSRLSLLHNLNPNGTFNFNTNNNNNNNSGGGAIDYHRVSSSCRAIKEEKVEAFQLLHQATPYIAFGFMVANDAISQAAQGKDSLHIIDLGMEHTLQWPSLIRTLASRTEGPPKLLRITAIVGDEYYHNLPRLQASIKGVIDELGSIGNIPLEFHMIPTEQVTPSLLTKEKLNLRQGEALFVNSIMHLHKYVKESRGSLKTILQAIKKLGPTLLTVVEQDANHNGPFFLGRFLESLHYYSAIFDSLEASLPRNSLQRMKIEKLHFAEEIRNIVAHEGSNRIERHERADQWRRQLGRAGFQVVGLKSMSQARMMLSVYGCDGYTLASDKGCLLLGWKGRPIILASAWQVHNIVSSDRHSN